MKQVLKEICCKQVNVVKGFTLMVFFFLFLTLLAAPSVEILFMKDYFMLVVANFIKHSNKKSEIHTQMHKKHNYYNALDDNEKCSKNHCTFFAL